MVSKYSIAYLNNTYAFATYDHRRYARTCSNVGINKIKSFSKTDNRTLYEQAYSVQGDTTVNFT